MSASTPLLHSTVEPWRNSKPVPIDTPAASQFISYHPHKPFLGQPLATVRKPGELASMATTMLQTGKSADDIGIGLGLQAGNKGLSTSLPAKLLPDPLGSLRVDSYNSAGNPPWSTMPTASSWEASSGRSNNALFGTRPPSEVRQRIATPQSMAPPAITSAGIRTTNSRESINASSILDPIGNSKLAGGPSLNSRSVSGRRLAPLTFDQAYSKTLASVTDGDVLANSPVASSVHATPFATGSMAHGPLRSLGQLSNHQLNVADAKDFVSESAARSTGAGLASTSGQRSNSTRRLGRVSISNDHTGSTLALASSAPAMLFQPVSPTAGASQLLPSRSVSPQNASERPVHIPRNSSTSGRTTTVAFGHTISTGRPAPVHSHALATVVSSAHSHTHSHAASSSHGGSSDHSVSSHSHSTAFSSSSGSTQVGSPNSGTLLGTSRGAGLHRQHSSESEKEHNSPHATTRGRKGLRRTGSTSSVEERDDVDADFPSVGTDGSSSPQARSPARRSSSPESATNAAILSTISTIRRHRLIIPGKGCVGLNNLGNTCYMNSILQSLNSVPELVSWFLREKKWSSKALVAPGYADLVTRIWAAPHASVVSPSQFLAKVSRHDIRWSTGRQQDSQEFLHSLLEVLQAETNQVTEKPAYKELVGKGTEPEQAAEAEAYARSWYDSVIDDIFGAQIQSTTICQACGHKSHCFDPSLDLSVPIPDKKRSGSVSVKDCMAAFTETERIDVADGYKCEACKKTQPITKHMQIYRYPKVLVLTLKRFSQNSGTFARFSFASKNSTPVTIDERLDLRPYCSHVALKVQPKGSLPPIYELLAVSHHSGSLGGGHYTAQGKSAADGHWYDFNDTFVRREAKPEGASSTAYVLFYRLAALPNPMQ